MKKIIISNNGKRYLSELKEFANGLPHGVLNKTKTDVGGTYLAVNCQSNYIIVCPFKDLINSIIADKNNQYDVFACFGGVSKDDFTEYAASHPVKKIAVTYDSFEKLTRWIGDATNEYKVLVDEYHLILSEYDYRTDAIDSLLKVVFKYNHYTFLSATPIDVELEIDELKHLPHYAVVWDNMEKIKPLIYTTKSVEKSLEKFIELFLTEGISATTIDGNDEKVEELFIFLNSVTTIKQVCDDLELENSDVKICCAENEANKSKLGVFDISSITTPNKKLNFFTSKAFQGCNLFSNNGLIVVVSDCNKGNTLIDISTTMEQISGRLRVNDEYQNKFRNTIIQFISTRKPLMNNEEFEEFMANLKQTTKDMIENFKSVPNKDALIKIMREVAERYLWSVIDTADGVDIQFNCLKTKVMYHKQALRESYASCIEVQKSYSKSGKFAQPYVQSWSDLTSKLAAVTTFSWQDIVVDFYTTGNPQYLEDYPELEFMKKYLTLENCNSVRFDKIKMMKLAKDKDRLDSVNLVIAKKLAGKDFVESSTLKELYKVEFVERGMTLTPKASYIKGNRFVTGTEAQKRVNGQKVKGYSLKSNILNQTI